MSHCNCESLTTPATFIWYHQFPPIQRTMRFMNSKFRELIFKKINENVKCMLTNPNQRFNLLPGVDGIYNGQKQITFIKHPYDPRVQLGVNRHPNCQTYKEEQIYPYVGLNACCSKCSKPLPPIKEKRKSVNIVHKTIEDVLSAINGFNKNITSSFDDFFQFATNTSRFTNLKSAIVMGIEYDLRQFKNNILIADGVTYSCECQPILLMFPFLKWAGVDLVAETVQTDNESDKIINSNG